MIHGSVLGVALIWVIRRCMLALDIDRHDIDGTLYPYTGDPSVGINPV